MCKTDRPCSCGHNHKPHNHEEPAKSGGCGCGHNHEEPAKSGGCGCGHDHAKKKHAGLFLGLSALCFVAGMLLTHVFLLPFWAGAIAFGLAAALSGWGVFLSGLKSLIRLQFNENVLMTTAIVTAFCLGEFSEAALVAILFGLGEIAEGVAERNARKSIQALTDMRPDTARLLTEAGETLVPAQQVTIGNLLAVNPFERFPVDGVITVGSSYVDNAALTGESLPIPIAVGDNVLSGGINGSSAVTMRATTGFADSTSSRILKLIEESTAKKGSAEKLITRFAKIYTPIVMVLALLVATIPPLLGLGAFSVWLYRALVMLVASCPCALVISVPLGFFAGIGAQSKIGMLLKGGKYLEALAKADAVILDKTGTLTTATLRIASVETKGISQADCLTMAAAAEALSTHPVGKAICARMPNITPATSIIEIPGKGITASYNGKQLAIGRWDFLKEQGVPLDLAPTHTVYLAADGVLLGGITLADTIKPDSPAAIAGLTALGINRIVMLTGDNQPAAQAVAATCGITEYHAALLPQDKSAFTQNMEARSKIFVGDGVNDAPVLAAANCGIAMGLGSQAAIETADAVLSSGKLSVLPRSIALARKTMGIIHFNIWFSIALKAVILVYAGLGYAPMWLGIVADVGVMVLTVLNAMRQMRVKPVA